MLIDASIHGPEAARALRRWRTGVVVGLVGSLLSMLAVWSLWYGDTGLEIDSMRLVFLAASGVGLLSSALVYFGVRDYVAAMHGSFGALPGVVLAVAGIELAFSGIGLTAQLAELASLDVLSWSGLPSRLLRFVFLAVSPLATVAAVLMFARVGSTIGARISPVMVGALVVVVVARLGLRALQELELFDAGGMWTRDGLHLLVALLFLASLSQHARALSTHRPRIPGGLSFGSQPDEVSSAADPADRRASTADANEWEAPGRALAHYRTVILAQMVLSLLSALLVLATRETPEQVGKIVSGTTILGLVVSLFLVVAVARYAASLPSLHATAPAKLAASLFALNALVGLVTTVLVVRAFSSGRVGLLFDLQDQLPALEAVGMLFGLGGLLALLYSFDALGHELGERALPIRTRGLKVALVILVACALAAKLGLGVLGPLVAVFGLVFAIGALFTVFSYLRVVGDVSALLLARAGVL
jgi:hypothetical protein